MDALKDSALGKRTEYIARYSPSLLYPIERDSMRRGLVIDAQNLPFNGADLWTAYELSWLDRDGKPEVAAAQMRVPCDSRAIFESKSLKLYLGSFNQTPFASAYDVARTLEVDLSVTTGAQVVVDLLSMSQLQQTGVGSFTGESLDAIKLKVDSYQPDPGLLDIVENGKVAAETLYTNLFRALCPVTGQPDLGSIQILYAGKQINKESLLRYLLSYREHSGFHEYCVERIFLDIMDRCQPKDLSVYAHFLRRGGIDVNPFRSTGRSIPSHNRLARQ